MRSSAAVVLALVALASTGCTLVGAGVGALVRERAPVSRYEIERDLGQGKRRDVQLRLSAPPRRAPEAMAEGTLVECDARVVVIRDPRGSRRISVEDIVALHIRDAGGEWQEAPLVDLDLAKRPAQVIRVWTARSPSLVVSFRGTREEPEWQLDGSVERSLPGGIRVEKSGYHLDVDYDDVTSMTTVRSNHALEGAIIGFGIDLLVLTYVVTHPPDFSLGPTVDMSGARW